MDRIMKKTFGVLAALVICGALAIVAGCSNPIDILNEVTVELKTAKGMYLVVKDVGPTANAAAVNPGTTITIVFDREIDESSVSTGVVIEPPVSYSTSYNSATKTLTILPATLDGATTYTITIANGLKGADNSDLKEPYAWSFTTANVPAGTFTVKSTSAVSLAGYTNVAAVKLAISANLQADEMRVTQTLSDFDSTATGWIPKNTTYDATLLTTTEETKTFYVQFVDKDGPVYSDIVTATIVYDVTAPVVTASVPPWLYSGSYLTRTATATASDANGISSYSWSQSATGTASGTVSFGTPKAASTTFSATTDAPAGAYVIEVEVADSAGNIGKASGFFGRDTVAPAAPTFTAASVGSTTANNKPKWIWTSGGGGGPYNYIIEDEKGSWGYKGALKAGATQFPDADAILDLTKEGYWPVPLGTYYFRILEHDIPGNHSTYASSRVTIVEMLPATGATAVDPASVTFEWPPFGKENGYTLYIRNVATGVVIDYPKLVSPTCTVEKTLVASTTYRWYVVEDAGVQLPEKYYYFTTGK